ncbi:MAG: hypothetical protein QM680_13505 [Luteolibacter sp.]
MKKTKTSKAKRAGVGVPRLVSQIDEMLRVFDWRTVYAVHCLTTDNPRPLENLKALARQMLMDVAASEKPITVMSNKFAAFIEPDEGNLMLEYNLERVEGLSFLAKHPNPTVTNYDNSKH